MNLKKGVYIAVKKDGTTYYRSSLTYKNKHISLGSFMTEDDAHLCYLEGMRVLNSDISICDYNNSNNIEETHYLAFDKWVSLVNFRDNKMYFKTPIYMMRKYFIYYYDINTEYKFDVDDLFFYSKHTIMKRNGHLFVADFGMQVNILSRYGIKNYAVLGKDFVFINGDSTDFRYKNIKIINKYNGVSVNYKNGIPIYVAKVHINGDYIIGKYKDENEAAIAYNKACHMLKDCGIINSYQPNYIENLSSIQYAAIHSNVKIAKKIRELINNSLI